MGSSPRRPGERKTPREDGCVKPVITGSGQAKEEGSMSEVRKSRDRGCSGQKPLPKQSGVQVTEFCLSLIGLLWFRGTLSGRQKREPAVQHNSEEHESQSQVTGTSSKPRPFLRF